MEPSVLRRRPAPSVAPTLPAPELTVKGGELSGTTIADALVEVINVTTAVTAPLRLDDALELGTSGQDGAFHGRLDDVAERDRIRLRARTKDGRVSPWIAAQIRGTGEPDDRAAFVDVDRLRIVGGDGLPLILHHTRLPLSEPDATIRFTNKRTGEFVDATVTEDASLEVGLAIRGEVGDEVTVAVSDGEGNLDFDIVSGTIVIEDWPELAVVEPSPMNRDGGAMMEDVEADIFIDGASPHDAKQGNIPDCYVVAGAMAVADAEPEALSEMIRWRKPGLVEVRLYPVENGIVGSPKWFPVSTRFYVRGGELLYGRVPEGHQLELWFPIIEKAYALLRGGYQRVASAGSVGDMMASILGRPNQEYWLNQHAAEDVLERIKRGLEERRAIAAGTFPASFNVDYSRSPITDSHAYAILDVVEKDGEPHILMLDPWAKGGDPDRNDGVRTVPLSLFAKQVQVVNIC